MMNWYTGRPIRRIVTFAAAATAAIALIACGSGGDPLSSTSRGSVDITRLPVGDAFFTSAGPRVGYAYLCSTAGRNNGFGRKGPWFNSDSATFDKTKRLTVQGSVSWMSNLVIELVNGIRHVTGNGLPNHHTGTFPVESGSAAYQYDKNPNNILARVIDFNLNGNPQPAQTPNCLPAGGSIGVMLSGAALYNAADADIRDGVAWEIQDSCQGHPQAAGQYHYHNVSSCVEQVVPGEHSPLVGYIADGFGIYGKQGEGGIELTNADLDECHGHVHDLTINGAVVRQYHYHATEAFPYAVGCYKGTPISLR